MEDEVETPLTGGNMDPVVRVGETVRRVTGPWTPAVHTLLRAYAEHGIAECPRPLGVDERGREILTFLPGGVMAGLPPAQLWSEDLLRQAAALLRRMHEASTDLVAADLLWRQDRHEPAEVICHNDVAPYNLLVSAGRLTGVIDHDMASPGPRVWDLAYLAYRMVPYAEDAPGLAEAPGFADAPRARAHRLELLLAAYGLDVEPAELHEVAAERLEALAAFTDARAAETGRADFWEHAAMYRRDAARLRAGAFE
ncbi:aminoglycoside phosphotransferase family protein [Bogoriella caseilytica]|uniref:Phosphotransferase family enzyme n=1 Tax=Bogoriella caseilytica TaxID=56055 RepID=A0A3N2BB43_9MICO|nr:aminoglycoside phosphotransferase family protein [Bogoriella caseilytica]ROR72402.1 phosphotransferase family enzyme [Bogoriella caseilytica]